MRWRCSCVSASSARAGGLGGAIGGGNVLLDALDEITQRLRLRCELAACGTLRLDVLGGAGLAGAPGLDQRCQPPALARQPFHLAGDALALLGDGLAQADQLGEVGAENGDLLAQIRHDGAEQHRGAHGFEDVLRADKHGRWRPAADALQRRQHLADQPAAALQRAPDRGLAGLEQGQALFEAGDAAFGGLRAGPSCRAGPG
jgi:hypothetical protein